jgi:hypothetical protein
MRASQGSDKKAFVCWTFRRQRLDSVVVIQATPEAKAARQKGINLCIHRTCWCLALSSRSRTMNSAKAAGMKGVARRIITQT